MRTLTGIILGITAVIIWHAVGWPWVGWLFTRIDPTTPAGWAPKHRAWQNGVEV